MRLLLACLALAAGCAQASVNPGDDSPEVDAGPRPDSGSSLVDASVGGPDSGGGPCTTMTRNLLRNGDYDLSPTGVDWSAVPIDPAFPIVTNEAGGIAAQSGAFRAWMGGLERPAASNKDSLHQDVVVPAMTTKLELKGFFELRTGEVAGDANIYDRAVVELATNTGTQLELVRAFDDNGPTTVWTAFNKVFTGDYSGQTVRLRFSTTADSVDPTSFFFDTVVLEATFCQ